MKVFVVTSGRYSDYGINAMFSTRELAESYIELFNPEADFNEIDEWALDDDPHLTEIKSGRKQYQVDLKKDGEVLEVVLSDNTNFRNIYYWFFAEYFSETRSFGNTDRMSLYCFATDKTHAIKIANEIRIQILANNTWGKNYTHK